MDPGKLLRRGRHNNPCFCDRTKTCNEWDVNHDTICLACSMQNDLLQPLWSILCLLDLYFLSGVRSGWQLSCMSTPFPSLLHSYSLPSFLFPSTPFPCWHSPTGPPQAKLGQGRLQTGHFQVRWHSRCQAGWALSVAGQGSEAGGQSGVGAVRHFPRMAGGSSHLLLAENYSTCFTALQVLSFWRWMSNEVSVVTSKELQNLVNPLIHFGSVLKDARQENYLSLILHWNI